MSGLGLCEDLELKATEKGDQKFAHPSFYEASKTTVDGALSSIDGAIAGLNSAINSAMKVAQAATRDFEVWGRAIPNPLPDVPDIPEDPIPPLPFTSLDEGLVYPLSADYYRVRQNADACAIFAEGGTRIWSGNLVTYAGAGATGAAFGGRASRSFAAHLGAYGVVALGVGEIVNKGKRVFDEVADFSERIAVRVEKFLERLIKVVLRLQAKVAAKFVPGANVISLIHDLIRIKKVIEDIKEDIDFLKNVVERLTGLKGEIEAWAATQTERLMAFLEAVSLIDRIPQVNLGAPLGDAPKPDEEEIQKDVDDTKPDFSDLGEKEQQDVEDALEELE